VEAVSDARRKRRDSLLEKDRKPRAEDVTSIRIRYI